MKSFLEHLKIVMLANEDAFIRVDQKKKTIFASSNINTRRLNMVKERHPDFKVQFIYKEEDWNALVEGYKEPLSKEEQEAIDIGIQNKIKTSKEKLEADKKKNLKKLKKEKTA